MTERVDMGAPDFALLEPLEPRASGDPLHLTKTIMGELDPNSEWGMDRFYEFDWAMRVLSRKADVLIYMRQEGEDD